MSVEFREKKNCQRKGYEDQLFVWILQPFTKRLKHRRNKILKLKTFYGMLNL